MRIDGHVHVFLSQRSDPERSVDVLAPVERTAPVELLLERAERLARFLSGED